MFGGSRWDAPLWDAYLHPAEVSDRWRAQGGRVVGLLGWTVPRELVTAAGMLPIRLSTRRLWRSRPPTAASYVPAVELTPAVSRVLSALLHDALDWLDGLVIGRDTEAHTKLFFVVRELQRTGSLPRDVPVAFFDLLRLPHRTSARYNRLRVAELLSVLADWAGRAVDDDDLVRGMDDRAATAASLRLLDERRTAPVPSVRGSQALVAAHAAAVLPGPEVRRWLAGAPRPRDPNDATCPMSSRSSVAGPRVFVTGSSREEVANYAVLERAGLCLVGEDHDWGDDGSDVLSPALDPLDRVVDSYQLAARAAARAGLAERMARTSARVLRTAPDAVLQLVHADDEASGWELAPLRAVLEVPVVSVNVDDGPAIGRVLEDAAVRVIEAVAGG